MSTDRGQKESPDLRWVDVYLNVHVLPRISRAQLTTGGERDDGLVLVCS
jgi:hypothetical protein